MTSVLGVPQISQTLLKDLDRVGRKYQRWTVDAYFELNGSYLVEYSRGKLEILPMPTVQHQRIAQRLNLALANFIASGKARGEVFFAGTRVEVDDGVFREPDVLFVPEEWLAFAHKEYVERVGLAIEVVSDSNRIHDLQTKRSEYAAAGIPEYWIVDPEPQRVTVLKLEADHYVVHGEFSPGDRAGSTLLHEFEVDVTQLFAD
jgi:Uma2 family endonuclease